MRADVLTNLELGQFEALRVFEIIEQVSNAEANTIHELRKMSQRTAFLTSVQGQLFELRGKAEGRETMGSKKEEKAFFRVRIRLPRRRTGRRASLLCNSSSHPRRTQWRRR